MNNELAIALGAGLGGMLGWGLADFFAKKTIDRIGDVTSLTWGHIFGSIALVLFAFYEHFSRGYVFAAPGSGSVWIFLIAFGILQAVVYLFVYKGFGKGQVAVLNPVFSSYSGIVAILSVVVFGEVVSKGLVVTLVLVFLGIILLSLDLAGLRNKKLNFLHIPGLREVGIATVLAAIWTLFWGKLVEGQDWLSFTLLMYVFMTITLLVVCRARKISLRNIPNDVWKFLVLIGVCEIIAYLAITMGYSATSKTSVIALLSGAFSLPTILLARVFLKEKIGATQTAGTVLIIIGIMFLSLV